VEKNTGHRRATTGVGNFAQQPAKDGLGQLVGERIDYQEKQKGGKDGNTPLLVA